MYQSCPSKYLGMIQQRAAPKVGKGRLTGDSTKCLQRFEVPDNDVPFYHSFGASSHCNSEDNNQRSGYHTETCSDRVNDDLLIVSEVVRS